MKTNSYLVVSPDDMRSRGWQQLDVLLLTGDAYVDHPSFPAALIGRLLADAGYRVGLLSRPDVTDDEVLRGFGPPRLFVGVTAGALDSMVANYTALRRPRSDDPYAPGGKAGGRPDRAVTVYANWVRRVFGSSVFLLAGGIEASLRRFAHYDYWSNSVRRSVLVDAPLDLILHGMADDTVIEVARFLDEGRDESLRSSSMERLRLLAGVTYRLPKGEEAPPDSVEIPGWQRIRQDTGAHIEAWRNQEKQGKRVLVQENGAVRVVSNPMAPPLSSARLDAVYALPFSRLPHPMYGNQEIPAVKQVQFSVTSHRGCAGGCAFCAIHAHQGKIVSSRSPESIEQEVRSMVANPAFDGTIRDVGGPSANMFGARCTQESPCSRPSCLSPNRCKHFKTAQDEYCELLERVARIPGVKHTFVTTGLRLDLALESSKLVEQVAFHHTSGHLKIAPEHTVPHVLQTMRKPGGSDFREFVHLFARQTARAHRRQQVIPYLMAAHPGSTLGDMLDTALFLAEEGIVSEQCQIFTPTPGTASTVMYATGVDPANGEPVFVERSDHGKRLQKALLLAHLPDQQPLVRQALHQLGRTETMPTIVRNSRSNQPRIKPSKRRRRKRNS